MLKQLAVPGRAVGGFFEMMLDTGRAAFRRPFQFGEFLDQTWMIARVSLVPTLLVSIPFTVLVAFTLNILLREIGAADLSGAGTAFGTITQLGPVVTVLVVAGAGATAICADLGARTIREEIDAMRVLGIDPIQRLVVPRVLASTVVALLLNGLVCAIGLSGGYVFSVFLQGVNPGAFINGLTVLTGLRELVLAEFKALLFGVMAGLVGCYRGLTVKQKAHFVFRRRHLIVKRREDLTKPELVLNPDCTFTLRTRGPCSSNLHALPYTRLRRPIYPLDPVGDIDV